MSKLIEIEVGDKTYSLGFPTRKDAKIAESRGLDVMSESGKIVTLTDKLFYTGLLAKHPSMTEYEAEKIMEQYEVEGGDVNEITTFLIGEYRAFMQSPTTEVKKKAKIVEM